MTDINTELAEIAEEEFTSDHELTEVAADAPKKGAAPPMKPESLPGERQDMGPAVVSPDAKSDPGKEASKKASKSGDLPDKGKPSAASGKPMGDGSGPMKGGAKEEVEDDEELEAIAETEEAEEETIEERVSAMDLSDDVNALTEGDELSTEFKKKAATIFEAAIRMKLKDEIEHLEEKYAAKLESDIEEARSDMAEKVDDYLNYVVEEWMKKNEMAVQHALKTEVAESFIVGLKTLFDEHNIAIPDEQFNMLDAAAEKVDELENKLNEQLETNIELSKENDELKRQEILLDVASDLADTEVEKFAGLTESVDYENEEDYREKVETIKESYFPKTQATNHDDTAAPINEGGVEEGDVTDTMAAYMSAISRNHIRDTAEA
tara:strand:- start:1028 stop:2164 length:1137 start_codon:yes stop_codon:yes gene_type:complete